MTEIASKRDLKSGWKKAVTNQPRSQGLSFYRPMGWDKVRDRENEVGCLKRCNLSRAFFADVIV